MSRGMDWILFQNIGKTHILPRNGNWSERVGTENDGAVCSAVRHSPAPRANYGRKRNRFDADDMTLSKPPVAEVCGGLFHLLL